MNASEDTTSDRNRQFVVLLAKHELKLSLCVHSLVPSSHDAEDILQETKVRLWEQFDRFEQGTDFAAWACTIARYMVRNYRKQTTRDRFCFSDDVQQLIADTVDAQTDAPDRRLEALAVCLKKLDQASREMLGLCYVEGLKTKDVAARIGRSIQGTYSAISRTRKSLIECVRAQLRQEEH